MNAVYLYDDNFYPRPPRGGRHHAGATGIHSLHISIPALREEGDVAGRCGRVEAFISIHALREEGDAAHCICAYTDVRISIHALREEGDGFR